MFETGNWNPNSKIEATKTAQELGDYELQKDESTEKLNQLLTKMDAFRQEHGPELARLLQGLNGKETPAQLGNALKDLPPDKIEPFQQYFADLDKFTKLYQEAEATQQTNPN